jgi:hypothetical protein
MNLRYFKQSVKISEFERAEDEAVTEGIGALCGLLARNIDGMVGFEYREIDGRTVLEFGNRLFTPKREAPNMAWAEINPAIDSNGFMENIRRTRSDFVHGEDNVVNYGVEKTAADGVKR